MDEELPGFHRWDSTRKRLPIVASRPHLIEEDWQELPCCATGRTDTVLPGTGASSQFPVTVRCYPSGYLFLKALPVSTNKEPQTVEVNGTGKQVGRF